MDNGFTEIDTPVPYKQSNSALHVISDSHKALDIDIIRGSLLTLTQTCDRGGFDSVYEFARSFRNEGNGCVHLPDFTLLEYNCAYWN
jgi:lysyl-tRNA synthetase class 2